MFNFSAPPPLSLYIHFPWCVQKCPYCDFNSHEVKSSIDESAYITALMNDLQQEIPQTWGRPVRSIFMGGGTPSLFSPESIDRLLSELRAMLNLSPNIEVTLEANPGTSDFEKFSEFRSAGINRLSVGIQSFENEKLQKLGRIHDRKQAIRAAEHAHNAGFKNFNLDLMFALPGQTLQQAIEDINTAIDLEPTHISYYQLTIEPNTYFHKHPPVVPDDELAWEMQTQGIEKLSIANYLQYEISAYSQPGFQCQHNLNYWQFGDYLGIGAGAHEKITIAPEQKILRQWKTRHPRDYLENNMTEKRIAGSNFLTADDASFEFMMNALRLNEGFGINLFQQHTGLPIDRVENTLLQAEEKDWLKRDENNVKTTALGRQYLNELLQLFMENTE